MIFGAAIYSRIYWITNTIPSSTSQEREGGGGAHFFSNHEFFTSTLREEAGSYTIQILEKKSRNK